MSEQIVTGKKYRILTDVAQKVWQRVSFWTKSSDVEFNDGKTAETKVGAISGITDSLVSTSSNIAASAKAVSQLNGNIKVYVGEDKKLHFRNGSGADTVLNFNGGNWELVLKITFGAAANNKGGTYTNDAAATDTPHGWYSSMNSTIRCVNGQITITGKCACAGRFGNQNDVAGYISNITVVSFTYL